MVLLFNRSPVNYYKTFPLKVKLENVIINKDILSIIMEKRYDILNTFQLSCFLAVAETLNFGRAAEQLHVTQPAVTQQIHSLEKELNVKLFKRTTRTVKITGEGVMFLTDARNMVAIAQRAKNRFQSPGGQVIQPLSLGCYSYVQAFLLAPVLKELLQQYEGLHPRLQVVPFHHLFRLLEEDDVDAILGFREPDEKKGSFIYRELAKVPVVCVCTKENPLVQKERITLADLKNEKLVLFDPARAQLHAAQYQMRLVEGRSPAELYFCESAEAAMVLVEAGFGVCVLPEIFVPHNLFLARLPVEGMSPMSFGIYYKSTQGNSPLKSLIQLLKRNPSSPVGP